MLRLLPLLLFAATLLQAEERAPDLVFLSNGDRISGAVVAFEGEKLRLESRLLGKVEIAWEAVERIVTAAPVYVSAGDERLLHGALLLEGADAGIETEEEGRVILPRDGIRAIRSPSEHASYVEEARRMRSPGFFDFWSTSLDAGASAQHGNAGALTFNLGTRADRTTAHDRLSLHFQSLFAQTRVQDGETQRAANAIRGGARYEVNVAQRAFTFGFGDFEFDQFRELDLRSVLGGGLGVRLARGERFRFDLLGGGSFNRELFSTGERRSSGEALFGNEVRFQLSPRTSLVERAVIYPNLTDTGEFRVTFDSSIVTQLSDRLSWQLTAANHYVSNPAEGARRNDLLMTTGIRLTFGDRREFKGDSRFPELMRRRSAPTIPRLR